MSEHRQVVILACLDAKMRAVGASNEALAVASGVCTSAIALARSKYKPMLLHNGLAVYEALNTMKFQYSKRGPKGARL